MYSIIELHTRIWVRDEYLDSSDIYRVHKLLNEENIYSKKIESFKSSSRNCSSWWLLVTGPVEDLSRLASLAKPPETFET